VSYQPPVNGLPANGAVQQDERLRQLIALLHTPESGGQDLEHQAEALNVEAILPNLPPQPPPQYGELPGEGYLYAHAPTERQRALVDADPETVRKTLLRAIEVCGTNAQLPFSEKGPNEWARAALEFAQAYLLLDPSVDQQGVPVGAQAQAQGAAQKAVAQAQGEATLANTHAQHDRAEQLELVKAAAQAHFGQDPEVFSHPETESGHELPPRLKDTQAMDRMKKKHENAEEIIRGVRADRPRPQPRVGQ
jgi:hypothetical protein